MLAFTAGDEHESVVPLHGNVNLFLVSFHLNTQLGSVLSQRVLYATELQAPRW